MKHFLFAATGLAIVFASPASAARITYTVSGDVTGTLNGSGFSLPATFTGIGDTDGILTVSNIKFNPLSSLTALAGGVIYTITTQSYFGIANLSGIAGLGFGTAPGVNAFTASAAAFASYSGIDSLAPTLATPFTGFVGIRTFTTDYGVVAITGTGPLTFSASLAAVPEPASWAMMIGGFALAGSVLRRRNVRTAASFA